MDDFVAALGPARVIDLPAMPEGPLDALVLMRALHEHLQPSAGRRPGRPTNRAWTLRRQVPFSPETWSLLDRYAQALSTPQRRVSAGQLAATILEQLLRRHVPEEWPAHHDGEVAVTRSSAAVK